MSTTRWYKVCHMDTKDEHRIDHLHQPVSGGGEVDSGVHPVAKVVLKVAPKVDPNLTQF